jgi:hypothetical protein
MGIGGWVPWASVRSKRDHADRERDHHKREREDGSVALQAWGRS